jgi:hypothetical protein
MAIHSHLSPPEVSCELSPGESLLPSSSSSLAEAASDSFLRLAAFAAARAFFVLALGLGGMGEGMGGSVRR